MTDKKSQINRVKHPLQRTILVGSVVFMVLLCLCLFIIFNFVFSKALYQRYNTQMADVLQYVYDRIDSDDLEYCIVNSKADYNYEAFQVFIHDVVDNLGVYYVYIVVPNEDKTKVLHIVSATSNKAVEDAKYDMLINMEMDYPDDISAKYIKAISNNEVSYFESYSKRGSFYTACRPIVNSDGRTIALLCGDVDIAQIKSISKTYTYNSIIISAIMGLIFVALLQIWFRQTIIKPVKALEESASNFAASSMGEMDIRELDFVMPKMNEHNEIYSLGESIVRMSENMKNYVIDIKDAEARATGAKQKADAMSYLAYKDSLTQVKNKAAFETACDAINKEIGGKIAEFSVLMVDLNNLKHINDTYGHQKGDIYITGSCKIICRVFSHCPVFRVGGDEFVAILKGESYDEREALFVKLLDEFKKSFKDSDREPWERFFAAAGMADYIPGKDKNIESVFQRADNMMYKNKAQLKKAYKVV